MKQHQKKIDSHTSLLGACALGTIGVKIFAILPLLLGIIAEHLSLDEAATGLVASSYFGAYFLVTLTSVIWIRRFSWQQLATVGSILVVAGLLLSAFLSDSYQGVLIGISISGLGAAVVYALSVTLIGDMTDKDRRFAIKLIPEQLIPALLMFSLPILVVQYFGLQGFLISLAAIIALLAVPGSRVPAKGRITQQTDRSAAPGRGWIFIGLLALLIYFAGFAGLWAFMERLAHDAIDPVAVGGLLALGLVSSAVGPAIAAWLGDRGGRIVPILVGAIITIASLVLLLGQLSVLKFALLMAVLPAAYYFSLAYIFGLISDADISGRLSSLISSALALGAAIGPGVFGFILESYGAETGYLFIVLSLSVGAILCLWVEVRLKRLELGYVSDDEKHDSQLSDSQSDNRSGTTKQSV
ncbi:MFS transporter [Amphritea sp. HPY]|uniref:MFS transporter n=1 Tax=Amphritea sp. HPY TaxID=3421652 RepID=UPI003D7DA125